MSEVMIQAIIGMPLDMAMASELSRRQFHDRAQQLLADHDALAAECERLREQQQGSESQAEYQRDRAEQFQAERDAALAELATVKKVAYGNLELLDETELLKAELAALKPFCEYCGGNDEFPQDHCVDCTRPAGDVAALKGGQAPVAMLRYARQVPGFENEMPHVVSCNDMPDGLYPVYPAPPAQASAWVPIALDALRAIEPFIPISTAKNGGAAAHIANVVAADKVRAALAAAPTPGASDGKGGDV